MAAAAATAQKDQVLKLPNPTTLLRSALFTKKLTGAMLSHIVYARNLFNETDFTDKMFEGQKIKVVHETQNGSRGAKCLYKWLEGAFDAFDKEYLKSLSLEILDKSGCILETYTFSYVYKGNGNVELGLESKDESVLERGSTHEEVKNMIRNVLVMTSTMELLPSDCTTSMKLAYYEEATPLDYEPPNFKSFVGPQPEEGHLTKISCGSIKTPFHDLTIKTKFLQGKQKQESGRRAAKVNCLCEIPDETSSMVKCFGCGTFQHCACYKILREEEASQKDHSCLKCSDTNVTDDFASTECIFRRVLAVCITAKAVSIRKLMCAIRFDADAAILNLKRLQREGFINKSAQAFSIEKPDIMHNVVKANLKSLKSQYFIINSQPL